MVTNVTRFQQDQSEKYFGKTLAEIKTLSSGQYFAWQIEKGERKTRSVPAARLRNLVQRKKNKKKTFPP